MWNIFKDLDSKDGRSIKFLWFFHNQGENGALFSTFTKIYLMFKYFDYTFILRNQFHLSCAPISNRCKKTKILTI